MRTTIDLDPELHAAALTRAGRERRTLSAVVNEALRQSFTPVAPVRRDAVTGLGVIELGHPVSASDVADALDD